MDKRALTERDICTKFILPAVKRAGWDEMVQVREEVYFTKGRIIVRGKLVTRGKAKKADFVLYYKPNIPIALIEAKDNTHSVGHAASASSSRAQRSASDRLSNDLARGAMPLRLTIACHLLRSRLIVAIGSVRSSY